MRQKPQYVTPTSRCCSDSDAEASIRPTITTNQQGRPKQMVHSLSIRDGGLSYGMASIEVLGDAMIEQ